LYWFRRLTVTPEPKQADPSYHSAGHEAFRQAVPSRAGDGVPRRPICIAFTVRWRVLGGTKDLRRLLDAETRVEYGEEHRNRMRDKSKSLGLASE